MKPVLYLTSRLSNDYRSNLFFVYDKVLKDSFSITESFKNLDTNTYPIFSGFEKGEIKTITDNDLSHYGMILDADKLVADKIDFNVLLKADFLIFVGCLKPDVALLLDKLNVDSSVIHHVYLDNINVSNEKDLNLVSYDALAFYYDEWSKSKAPVATLDVLVSQGDDLSSWSETYKNIGVELREHFVTTDSYRSLLEGCSSFYKRGCIEERLESELGITTHEHSLSITEFKALIEEKLSLYATKGGREGERKSNGKVNIVCFNPTYLFKDLVERFVAKGCVHSDFPMSDADTYIWMRPQEIWHLEYLLANKDSSEIGVNYKKAFKGDKTANNIDIANIKKRSVTIHHGTCYKPIYQFDYDKLAKSLYNTASVVGVCEFDECYGPSASVANKNNFEFQPIGYDHTLFSKEVMKVEEREPNEKLKIGFVGRAYGTNKKDILAKSNLAEPKGYRKGGDILAVIANRLKLEQVDFELQILGQNWDELVEDFESHGIECKYYARDKDLTYRDFPNVYKDFDILLITARCEGGPVSAIEALSLGIDVISTDVGVVKHLDELYDQKAPAPYKDACRTFTYDKKWHIADIDSAVSYIKSIASKGKTHEDRVNIRNIVGEYTTEKWVDVIISKAKRI